ncbi:MAG: hypothetical protein Q8P67_10325 [archaeon]|nr:hypothetical protein [archaeon]
MIPDPASFSDATSSLTSRASPCDISTSSASPSNSTSSSSAAPFSKRLLPPEISCRPRLLTPADIPF